MYLNDQISCEIFHISCGEYPCSRGENNTLTSVLVISVSVLVLANVDISYIGIGKISVKIHRYRQNIVEILAKMPDIGRITVK